MRPERAVSTRGELLARIRQQKRKIAQLLQDREAWNENNRGGETVDAGLEELTELNACLDRMIAELSADR